MNNFRKRYTKIPCPTCGAAVGQSCRVTNLTRAQGTFSLLLACPERYHQTNVTVPSKLTLPRAAKSFRQNTTSNCRDGGHSQCSGFNKSKHGIKIPCGCLCHHRDYVIPDQI